MNGVITYVRITNNCTETIKVYLRYVMHTKPSLRRRRKRFIALKPRETSYPVAKTNLVGGKNWEEISSRPCVLIETVEHEHRFFVVKNTGRSPIAIPIKISVPQELAEKYPKQERTIVIRPGAFSRSIDKKALKFPGQLQELVKARLALVKAVDIGPSKKTGAVGSLDGEDVYICYQCGGPIIFRYNPPRPVHV